MGLLSASLVAMLTEAGLVDGGASWSESDVLGEWLDTHDAAGAKADAVLSRYFGLPYRLLEKNVRLQAMPLSCPDWAVYQLQSDGCCVCLRPPTLAERDAYEQNYGDRPLYLSDALRVHSALLRGQMTETMAQPTLRRYALEDFLRADLGHVDGLIGKILVDAIDAEATDVHFFKMDACFRVVFRLNGVFESYAELPPAAAEGIINKLKLLAEMDIAEHRLPQDGHILLSFHKKDYNLRLATLPLFTGEKVVLRVLPEEQRRADWAALGFAPAQAAQLEEVLRARHGLVLITGPTNSGKTTTLYACLKQLGKGGALVYSIEDPIEAVLPEVQQMQVNGRSGFTFATGLRGILRSDPDVIAVGELRDAETVNIAARAALSGQMVIATLHAEHAQEAVDRLRDLGLSDLLLSAVLAAVVNQRLLAKSCPVCGGSGAGKDGRVCHHCLGSGRDGRTGVQEIWRLSAEEQAHIAQGASGFLLREEALARGFRTLWEDARFKGLNGGRQAP